MTKICKQLTVLLGLISVLGLAQCGGTSNSAHTNLKIFSQNAVVINAPFSYTLPLQTGETTPTTITIGANWFLFNFEVDNNSNETLYLVNFDLNLTGYDNTGSYQTGTASLNTSNACVPPAATSTGTVYDRPYLAIINPGVSYNHLQGEAPGETEPSGFTGSVGCDYAFPVGGPASEAEGWYIEGLDTSVTNWEVQVSGEGWFTDSSGEANERLVLQNYFSTQ